MTGFVVAGTDTDAGKTAFCVQWMAAFADRFAYWKPCETGTPDSETLRQLVPIAKVFPSLVRFAEPVAPPLAAARQGKTMASVAEITAAVPQSALPLVIETFGSPLSPLTATTLQAELIIALQRPVVLVSPSTVGAVGRSLQAIAGMQQYGFAPAAVVLIGPRDEFAESQIQQHTGIAVFAVHALEEWTPEAARRGATRNTTTFASLLGHLQLEQHDSGAALIQRDRAAVWHPYTSLADPDDPLPVVGAQNEFLHLADGRRLIDGISSWWTILQGHRHPPLVAALREATNRFDHVLFAGVTHPPAVELAELLLASAPWPGGRVFYSDNGSTAVEVALKMAYQAWCHRGEPQRTLFIGFENGYHGDTFGAMAAGRDPVFFGRFEPLLFRTIQVPVLAERLAAVLAQHRGEIAAVILEPLVQGAGGMRMHSPAELHAIFDVCRAHGVLFICDEVMTGGGRTGSLWAFEQAGIAPDLICTAKTLTGGLMPLAATLASPEVVAAFDTPDLAQTFFHGHSYTAHPLACTVAAANWRALLTGQWRADARRIETVWRERVGPLATQPGVKDVRLTGTIAAIEFASPGGYLAESARQMRHICLEHGVFLRPLGNVLYTMPPLRTSTESLQTIADAMEACVAAAAAKSI